MKFELSSMLQVGGIVIGLIAALSLVSRHPVTIFILGLGAAVYFLGQYLKRKG